MAESTTAVWGVERPSDWGGGCWDVAGMPNPYRPYEVFPGVQTVVDGYVDDWNNEQAPYGKSAKAIHQWDQFSFSLVGSFLDDSPKLYVQETDHNHGYYSGKVSTYGWTTASPELPPYGLGLVLLGACGVLKLKRRRA